jgi:chemotaxis protein CheX
MTSHAFDDSLVREREDLEGLVADVVANVFGEEAEAIMTVTDPAGAAPDGAAALLVIHDESDDTYLGVQVRVSPALATLLAARMLACDEPTPEDLLDAVGELGNIVGGNVKSLLFTSARLSLPSATLDDVRLPPAREDAAEPTLISADVLGEPLVLALVPHVDGHGLHWPPSAGSEPVPEVVEAQS